MPQLSIGPIDIRFYAGQNWTNVELALVTARNAGWASRETAVRAGFKSEHLLETFGEDNPADTTVIDGTTYVGRVSNGPDDIPHVLSSAQVAARIQRAEAMRQGLKAAQQAATAVTITGDTEPSTDRLSDSQQGHQQDGDAPAAA